MAEQATPPQPTPIYVSYLTFTNLLDWLRELGTLPSQFDRSFWGHKFSGSGGGQLMAGLRWLGLLNGDAPNDRLEELALASNEQRRELLLDLLKRAYGADFIAGLPRTTPKLVNEQLAGRGTTDATHAKARSFFINAAKAVGLQLPPQVAKQARNKPTVSRKAAPKAKTGDGSAKPQDGGVDDGHTPAKDPPPHDDLASLLHPTLVPLLRDLVAEGPAWTSRERARWKRTWDQTLDYAYPEEEDEEAE